MTRGIAKLACVTLACIALLPACLPEGTVCCSQDAECGDGARCFEGRCALRCDDDSQCEEGERCDVDGRVCTAEDPSGSTLARCPYGGTRAAP